jgi:hypothetical protein
MKKALFPVAINPQLAVMYKPTNIVPQIMIRAAGLKNFFLMMVDLVQNAVSHGVCLIKENFQIGKMPMIIKGKVTRTVKKLLHLNNGKLIVFTHSIQYSVIQLIQKKILLAVRWIISMSIEKMMKMI